MGRKTRVPKSAKVGDTIATQGGGRVERRMDRPDRLRRVATLIGQRLILAFARARFAWSRFSSLHWTPRAKLAASRRRSSPLVPSRPDSRRLGGDRTRLVGRELRVSPKQVLLAGWKLSGQGRIRDCMQWLGLVLLRAPASHPGRSIVSTCLASPIVGTSQFDGVLAE